MFFILSAANLSDFEFASAVFTSSPFIFQRSETDFKVEFCDKDENTLASTS
jgi:hypothetical protein